MSALFLLLLLIMVVCEFPSHTLASVRNFHVLFPVTAFHVFIPQEFGQSLTMYVKHVQLNKAISKPQIIFLLYHLPQSYIK